MRSSFLRQESQTTSLHSSVFHNLPNNLTRDRLLEEDASHIVGNSPDVATIVQNLFLINMCPFQISLWLALSLFLASLSPPHQCLPTPELANIYIYIYRSGNGSGSIGFFILTLLDVRPVVAYARGPSLSDLWLRCGDKSCRCILLSKFAWAQGRIAQASANHLSSNISEQLAL